MRTRPSISMDTFLARAEQGGLNLSPLQMQEMYHAYALLERLVAQVRGVPCVETEPASVFQAEGGKPHDLR